MTNRVDVSSLNRDTAGTLRDMCLCGADVAVPDTLGLRQAGQNTAIKDFVMGTYIEGLVSVIVPVFNREKLVGATIESILAQSYPRVEIVAVNDGSTDNSLKVLRAYSEKHPDRIVVVDQQNTGQSRARNHGILRARGEFIAFLDSDDTWHEDKLSMQMPLFREDVGLVFCGIHEVDEHGRVLQTILCDPKMRGNVYHHLLIRNRMTGGTVVVTRKAIDRVGCFEESFKAAENWDLWIRIAKEFSVDFVNEPLVNYLRHPGNLSCDNDRMIQAAWTILQKHIPQGTARDELRDTYQLAYAHYYYNLAVRHIAVGDYRQARKTLFECWKYSLFYRDSAIRMIRILLGRRSNRLLSACKTACKTRLALATKKC
jgi:glycosyltransferase involved in cell wall biosynthesis